MELACRSGIIRLLEFESNPPAVIVDRLGARSPRNLLMRVITILFKGYLLSSPDAVVLGTQAIDAREGVTTT